MASPSPFFPGFHRNLFGRRPLSEVEKISRARVQIDVLCLAHLCSLFGEFIPSMLIDFRTIAGANSRRRIYTPMVTFWAFLGQVLDPGSSCRKAVSAIQTLFAFHGLELPSTETKAYCKARLRLPVRLLRQIADQVAQRLCAAIPHRTGGRTLVVDGTTVTMPDTLANQAKYPQHGQKKGCGFPIMKLVGLFCLDSGAWLAVAKSHFNVHESRLFSRLMRHLRSGDTLVADRGFCSYVTAARLRARGVHFVLRIHQARKVDFGKGRRLGKGDHLITWTKPAARPRWMSPEEYRALPDSLLVRETRLPVPQRMGWRTTSITLVSSFVEEGEKSLAELGDYFLRRWKVELHFEEIKIFQGMDVLRTKSPEMICRELLMHMITYNLIRAVAMQSAAQSADPAALERVSYKGTGDRIRSWRWSIWNAPSEKKARALATHLRATVAEDLVPYRPGRREPRAVKRRPKNYPLLNKPRREMVEIPHRNTYRKPA